MSQIKHTPGPWFFHDGVSPRVYLIDAKNAGAVGEVVYCETRRSADARLIAAAPDLLEALRRLVALADENPFCPIGHAIEHVVTDARVAIAKAEGTSGCHLA